MSKYMDYNEWLNIEVKRLNEENKLIKQQNNELKNVLFNTYLKQQHQERLITDLKLTLSSYDNFVDELYPD